MHLVRDPKVAVGKSIGDSHPLMQLLNVSKGDRVIDLGCGEGSWSKRIAALGADVTGIDSDERALQIAETNGVATRLLDARALDYHETFDAAFSNAALHWMKPIRSALESTYAALKPGGRFVGELGGHGNIASIRVALRHAFHEAGLDFDQYDPWEFPLSNDFCNDLQDIGFHIKHVETFPRYTPLPDGCHAWLDLFLSDLFAQFPADTVAVIRQKTVDILKGIASRYDDDWIADYVRIRFLAIK